MGSQCSFQMEPGEDDMWTLEANSTYQYDNHSTILIHYNLSTFLLQTNFCKSPWLKFNVELLVAIVLFYSIFIVIGALGNGLVCWVVLANRHMRTPRNLLILNLATSDLILCLFTQPFNLLKIATNAWRLGAFMCKMVPTTSAVNVYVSTFSIIAIALDRFRLIVRPTDRDFLMQPVWSVAVLTLIWVLAFVCASPMIAFNTLEHFRLPSWFCIQEVCLEVQAYSFYRSSYSLITMLIQYIFPILVLSVAHVRIINRLQQRIKTQNMYKTQQPNIVADKAQQKVLLNKMVGFFKRSRLDSISETAKQSSKMQINNLQQPTAINVSNNNNTSSSNNDNDNANHKNDNKDTSSYSIHARNNSNNSNNCNNNNEATKQDTTSAESGDIVMVGSLKKKTSLKKQVRLQLQLEEMPCDLTKVARDLTTTSRDLVTEAPKNLWETLKEITEIGEDEMELVENDGIERVREGGVEGGRKDEMEGGKMSTRSGLCGKELTKKLWKLNSVKRKGRQLPGNNNNNEKCFKACQKKISREKRINRLLITIALVFAASWMPLTLLNIVSDLMTGAVEKADPKGLLNAVCHLLVLVSACVNPVLYGWLNENFQREFRRLLCPTMTTRPSNSPPEISLSTMPRDR